MRTFPSFEQDRRMFVSNHIGIACGGELSGHRIVYLSAGEDIVVAGCAADEQNLSIGQESSRVTKAPILQVSCWSKHFCGWVIQFGSKLWSIPGRVSACDQHLTILQQSRCQSLPGSHHAPRIFKCSGLRIIQFRGGCAAALIPATSNEHLTIWQ